MIAQEQNGAIIVSKVKYLGSCLLPSPIELEGTIALYPDEIRIPELDAIIPVSKVSKIEWVIGKDLPSETIVMCGVLGAIIDKSKPYILIEIGSISDSMLFKLDDIVIADKLVQEIKAAKGPQ
jgi:hypothetical protein